MMRDSKPKLWLFSQKIYLNVEEDLRGESPGMVQEHLKNQCVGGFI